jgi:hypothetical protein
LQEKNFKKIILFSHNSIEGIVRVDQLRIAFFHKCLWEDEFGHLTMPILAMLSAELGFCEMMALFLCDFTFQQSNSCRNACLMTDLTLRDATTYVGELKKGGDFYH